MQVDEDEYESVLIDAHAARDKKSAGGEPADWEWKELFSLYCQPSLCAHVIVAGVRQVGRRKLITMSEYAEIEVPNLWPGYRCPLHFGRVED